MKKKNPKDAKTTKKPPQNLSLFIPSNFISLIEEDFPLSCPEERAKETKKFIPEIEPFDIPPEWEDKTEEEINEDLLSNENNDKDKDKDKETITSKKSTQQNKVNRSFQRRKTNRLKSDKVSNKNSNNSNNDTIEQQENNNNINIKWKDPMHEELINNLPLSFLKLTENNFLWLSPEEYILNEKIDEDIKKVYPKRNYVKMREDIKDFYKVVKEKEKQEKEKQEKLEQERIEKEKMEKEKIEKEKEKDTKANKKLTKKATKIIVDDKKKEETKSIISNKTETIDDKNISKEKFNTKDSLENLLNDDSFIAKNNLYKDFIFRMDTKFDIQILKTDEREETDEEYSSRVTATIEKQKEALEKYKSNKNKKEKKPIVQKPDDIPRTTIVENLPSNISVKYIVEKEKSISNADEQDSIYTNLSLISWLSSIFQFIKDLEITDCVTHNSIFKNIYPQKNGTPIYNPSGHYLIKLYFMGKPRKIEIDDRIPCSKDGEYIFPRCQNLCEIWPALYTKALLKLNIFKVKHPSYWHNEENVDTNFIYAMTGYHAEIIQGLDKEDQIQNLLTINLNDDNFLNKKKYILCLNLYKGKNKTDEYYEDIIAKYAKKRKEEEENNKKALNDIIEETLNEGENESSTKFLDNNSKNELIKNKYNNASNSRSQSKKGMTYINKHIDLETQNQPEKITSQQQIKKQINSPIHRFKIDKKISTFDKNYWEKNASRFRKRQKTVKLNIMKITESKLKIITNYAYSINDFFSNGNFNMDRLKPLNLEEIKRNLKQGSIVYKQLSEKEKIEYKLERKKIREKQLGIKYRKVNELKDEGKPFLIIKIKNDSIGQYDLNSILFYSEKEIFMAKKCMLNNWKYPPPEFFDNYFKRTDKLMEEEKAYNDELHKKQELIRAKYEKNPKKEKDPKDLIILNEPPRRLINDFDWTRIDYIESLLDNDLSLYESTEDHIIKDPILKTSGGNWMSFSDFISLFNSFLVLHNPNALFSKSNICIDNNWKDYKIDCFEPLNDFMVLKLNNEEIENKDKMYESFIIFEPNNDKTLTSKNKIDNYIILDILDEERNPVFKNITMNKFYSTHHVENLNGNKNYYIIIRGGIYQFGYVMQIYSEGHKIENMAYENYLMQNLGYQLTTIKIDHPLINDENFYLLSKLKICPALNEEGNPICEGNMGDFTIMFNIKYPIKFLKPFIKIFVQKDESYNLEGKEIFSNEEIYLTEGNYIVSIFFKNLSYPVVENSCDVDIVYSNPNYSIQHIEIIEPYIIKNEYAPNRHNVIFRQLIFAPEKVYCSFGIELLDPNNSNANHEEKDLEKSNESSKLNDKIKIELEIYQLGDSKDTNIPLLNGDYSFNIRGNLIKKFGGYNKILIPNLTILGGSLPQENKKSPGGETHKEENPSPTPYPYLFICHIEEGFNIKNSIAEDKLTWSIKVFSSEKIYFVKEISKEEKEQLLKNNWEENEPGRAEKAKMSRKKYFLEKIKKEGGILTEEQMELIKKDKNDTNKEEPKRRGSISKRKKKIAVVAVNKKSEDKKERDKLILKKVLPKSNEHYSKYIKNYLDYAYKKRTTKINSNIIDQYLKTINNPEILDEKNKKIEKKLNDFNLIIKTEMRNTFYKNKETDSNKKKEILNTFYKNDIDNRVLESNKLNELIKDRDILKQQFKDRLNAKSILSDIIKNHSTYNYDFNYMYESYNNTVKILGENYPDEEKLYKILCNYKEDELKKLIDKYTNKDRNNAIKLIEELENIKLKISENLIKKIKELVG